MKPSVIVWDLETVPDLAGFAAANDLVGKPDAEIREAIGDKFPKHIYHSIICIGALIARWECDHWAVSAVGAPHIDDRTKRYFREGKIKEVADYCETDVVGTYQLWLRYQLFTGALSHKAFEDSHRKLSDFMNARIGKSIPDAE
jgi:predicted PolB exonuclease-like 3'-5' exonuclease